MGPGQTDLHDIIGIFHTTSAVPVLWQYGTFTLHGTRTGNGTGTGSMGSNILCRNVHTGLSQGQGPGLIVSYCASFIPCSGSQCSVPGPIKVLSELTINASSIILYG